MHMVDSSLGFRYSEVANLHFLSSSAASCRWRPIVLGPLGNFGMTAGQILGLYFTVLPTA